MVLSQQSDSQLVKSYISGQETAFEVLLNRHQEAIFKFIYHKLKDTDLANDIFQETFVKVIQKLKVGAYQEEGKFLPWVLRIAHNLVIDHFRRQRKHRLISERNSLSDDYNVFHRIASEDANFVQKASFEELKEQLHVLLTHLPDAQKEMIYMRLFQDRAFKEIAESEGISINTALGRMRYAVLNLRKLIETHELSMELS
ncbi:MAG: sigma-70 family RNA polymerase sigma factor [Flavobacteriales bacterium]